MRYFLIAGEQSGDLHGSNLIRELLIADPGAEIFCWGGDLMASAGAKLLMHYKETAFMGFVTILLNLRKILGNISACRKDISEINPDVLILIDYPGFNLRIAKFGKTEGIRIFYYISPKLWAWKESRVEKIRKYVDRMFIIFPFEVNFYEKHGIQVAYYGNPLVDEIEKKKILHHDTELIKKNLGLDERPVITMLAGSRKHEVGHILPKMLTAVKHFPGYQFVLAGVSSLPGILYEKIIGDLPVKVYTDKTYELLSIAEAALIKSGTSTLEAALFGVPQVVCYKGDSISFAIARRLVKVRFISLVNLIMGKEVVKELIQFLLTEENIVGELSVILKNGPARQRMIAEYDDLKQILGPEGASRRIALEMVREIQHGS